MSAKSVIVIKKMEEGSGIGRVTSAHVVAMRNSSKSTEFPLDKEKVLIPKLVAVKVVSAGSMLAVGVPSNEELFGSRNKSRLVNDVPLEFSFPTIK